MNEIKKGEERMEGNTGSLGTNVDHGLRKGRRMRAGLMAQIRPLMLIPSLALLLTISVQAFSATILNEGNVCRIGSSRQLFVDTWLIDSLQGVDLFMHTPVNAGEVFKFGEVPWENPYPGYCTVIKDESVYRLYYRSNSHLSNGAYSYAESTDGIHWVRPVLRLHEFNGSLENNIIIQGDGGHSFSPFIDTNPATLPSEKYKAIGLRRTADDKAWLLMAFGSADGVRWNLLNNAPVYTNGAFDSQNVPFWSKEEGRYVLYYRTKSGGHTGIREVSKATSADFMNWENKGKMVQVDRAGNEIVEEIYINQTSPYYRAEQIYIGKSARFVPGRCALLEGDDVGGAKYEAKFTDTSDAVLMVTRPGMLIYNRPFMQSWIRPGLGIKNWSTRSNYPALGIVPTGENEMSVYLVREYGFPSVKMDRYAMRVDGIASVRAGYVQGELLTKPLIFEGHSLSINYSTSSSGFIKIEVQDEGGKAIQGFSLNDCLEIYGDRIDETVRWGAGKSLSELSGTKVRLRIVMKDADLYSFKFNP